MRATFLDHIPPSGNFLERSYGPTLGCGWVLFEPEPAEAWVGAFGLGGSDCRQVFRCGNTPVFLVLANGKPYLVNGETGELVSDPTQSNFDELMAALPIPGRDLIIAADNSSLFAISSRGLRWESPLVAISGIDLLEATSDELRGHLGTEDGVYHFTLRFKDWQLVQGEAIEEYFGKPQGILTRFIERLRIKLGQASTVRMFSARRAQNQKIRDLLNNRRGCLVAVLVSLLAVGVLAFVPVHGYRYDSGPPEILSNPDLGIILVDARIWADRKTAPRILWCSSLGYWAPPSCLPETRLVGLHIWFLRASGVEYHALAPFSQLYEAYVYNGRLRWQSGREHFEWVDGGFRRLSESEEALPFQDQKSVGDVIKAEGWSRHPVGDQHQMFSLGPYRVRYSRPAIEDGPTEIVIEEGPVVGTLYSRAERWHFTWWSERLPEFSVRGQRPTG